MVCHPFLSLIILSRTSFRESSDLDENELTKLLVPYVLGGGISSEFLFDPEMIVAAHPRLAKQAREVGFMHAAPTGGGLVGAPWELTEACRHTLI